MTLNTTSWYNHVIGTVPVITLVFGKSCGVMFYQSRVCRLGLEKRTQLTLKLIDSLVKMKIDICHIFKVLYFYSRIQLTASCSFLLISIHFCIVFILRKRGLFYRSFNVYFTITPRVTLRQTQELILLYFSGFNRPFNQKYRRIFSLKVLIFQILTTIKEEYGPSLQEYSIITW